MHKRHAVVETSLGEITVVAHDGLVVGIYFPHHWYPPAEDTLGDRVSASCDDLLGTAASQLAEYLAGQRMTFDVPTATSGDVFQERVWALLNDIPYGETTTYGALAEQLGDRSLAQAVGGAVGRNPLSVLVPCHRVLGKNGKLTGYAGGLRRKQHLLTLEAEHSATPRAAAPRRG
jgi:methylated-DNA-[protein]-cysteine S-methyltransferase